jgi:NAD(P)-dependent dehydrogenase (short-subunit alcohol dehydrogenase family)
MTRTDKVWLITGVSTGFGREIAKQALARGDVVAGTLRQESQLAAFAALSPGRAHPYQLDVTDPAAVARVVQRIIADTGRIDVVVNNAGYGLIGVAEEVSDREAQRLFETNFFGLFNVVKEVLPQLRSQRSGHIVNMSSLAGTMGIPGMALYSASKFAVEGLSEALAGELGAFGIRVTIVEPGGFRTDFAGRSIGKSERVLSDYADTPGGALRAMLAQYHGREPGDPVKAAGAILKLVDSPSPPLRLALGPDALALLRGRLTQVAKDYEDWQVVTNGMGV